MAKRVAVSSLNASTIDILNVIRQNASYEYQSSVPEVTQLTDIPKVGEVITGTPALANQFLNALINRIALVRAQSATFNNPYSRLKKGYLAFGETVEDIFVNIAKVVVFDPDKASAREFQRTTPDVRSAFHVMNWRVIYPVTIQDEDLTLAFTSAEGVTDLIAKIVDSIYTAAEYDEFLLFKYLLIKGISHGNFYPVSIGDGTDMQTAGTQFRGISNVLPFMSSDYNMAGVKTTTPKNRQVIFMDAFYNAQYDIEVLASAFNMDKAEYQGALYLIDDWTSFDNERFEVIRSQSDGLEEVTDDELALLENVKAVTVDENWFQVYDNKNKFTEKYVASGLYWNYFYHTWKTVSYSPFANAVAYVTDTVSAVTSFTVNITTVSVDDEGNYAIALEVADTATLSDMSVQFVETESMAASLIAITADGALYVPASAASTAFTLTATIDGATYTASAETSADSMRAGYIITMNA